MVNKLKGAKKLHILVYHWLDIRTVKRTHLKGMYMPMLYTWLLRKKILHEENKAIQICSVKECYSIVRTDLLYLAP